MKTVFVVEWVYEGTFGIFTTRDKAEEYVSNSIYKDNLTVIEVTLDEGM